MVQHTGKIAVTGGIGCGKSSVVAFFAAHGIPVVSADGICHQLYQEPAWSQRIAREWGAEVMEPDGGINRKRLGDMVFRNPEQLEKLNRIVQPEIRSRVVRWLETNHPLAVVEVPLLFESGWEGDFDAVIAVWSPLAVCRERVRERGWTPEELELRSHRQWTPERKLELADFGIINYGSREMLTRQCERIFASLRGR